MKFRYITNFTFLNNPKDLDLSYKTDLDLLDCFGRKKTLSYNRRNMVVPCILHNEKLSLQHVTTCMFMGLDSLKHAY